MKNIFTGIRLRRVEATKVLLLIAALILFTLSALTFIRQSHQSERSVQSHTQTLNEIDSAVKQLKMNNQVNHNTTILYVKCLGQLIVISEKRPVVQADLDACLPVSGI